MIPLCKETVIMCLFILLFTWDSLLFSYHISQLWEKLQWRYQRTSWSFQWCTQKWNNKTAESKHFLLYYRLPHGSQPWLCQCTLSPEEYKHSCLPLLITLPFSECKLWGDGGIVTWEETRELARARSWGDLPNTLGSWILFWEAIEGFSSGECHDHFSL